MDIEVQASPDGGWKVRNSVCRLNLFREAVRIYRGVRGYLQEMLAEHEAFFWQRPDITLSGWSTARVSSFQAVFYGLSG
jgi:hypothetical protein